MEPTTMTNLKVLSAVAIMALAIPTIAPSASFAAPPGKGGGPGIGRGGAPGMRGGAPGGGAPMARFNSGPRINTGVSPGPRFAGNPGGGGGNWHNNGGGNWRNNGGNWHRRGGYIPGAVAGAVIGGAIASSYGYYDPGYAVDPGYYDDGSGVVAVAPQGDDDSVAYCMQTYRSYDPQSGTYLGYDGLRHPCP
jgi:hypothetical protein